MAPHGPCNDGVSYIDLATAYARGDWAHALSAYWSPLYSLLLAPALGLLHPSAAAEFPVVHCVNFLIFIAALASFDFLWRTWMEDHCARTAGPNRTGWVSLPPWALVVIGYSVFAWSSISWIGVQQMNPDLLVAGLTYAAAGLTLRLRRGSDQPGTAVLLGFVLGLGFLAKAVMLPLAFVFLLVAFWPMRNRRRAALSLLGAGIAFLIVTVPFITALSRQQGHLTFGETGRLNYAWYVNNVPQLDWQGEGLHGTPLHPPRLLYPAPPVYEFAGPIGGTYPIWTDPSYWYAGVRVRFNWHQQVAAVRRNLAVGRRQIVGKGPRVIVGEVLMLLLALVLVVKRRLPLLVRWDLLLLSLAPTVLYTLVLVETRYLGPAAVLFWLALLPDVRLPAHRSQALVIPVTLLILLMPALGLARASARDIAQRKASRADWDTATGLHALGIHTGDGVGCIGMWWDTGWARLARVSVVAHVPLGRETQYWGASPKVQAAVLHAFSQAGVRAVVAEQPPAGSAASGWHRLGATDRYARLLNPPTYSSFARRRMGEQAHG